MTCCPDIPLPDADSDNPGNTLKYDAWNRLVQVDNGNTTLKTYAYDAAGRRITESAPGTNPTELCYSSQWQVIQEDVNASGLTTHAQYVWSMGGAGSAYPDAMVLRDYDFNTNGTFSYGERTYVLQDANFNVTALMSQVGVDSSGHDVGDSDGNGSVDISDLTILSTYWGQHVVGGDLFGDFNHDGVVDISDLTTYHSGSDTVVWQVTERLAYDAYGRFDTLSPTWSANANYLAWQYTFQGLKYDSVTGLFYDRNRDTSPTMMRAVETEPSGADPYVDGLNLYLMYAANPINREDPWGLQATTQSATQPRSDHEDVTAGRFEWTLKTLTDRSGADFTLTFTPDKQTCKCANISFIQVITKYTSNGVTIHGGVENPEYWKKFESKSGTWVDHLQGATSPYYGGKWSANSQKWVTDGSGHVGNGPSGSPASMNDTPNGPGTAIFRAEIFAVCIDTKTVYGGVQWGFDASPPTNVGVNMDATGAITRTADFHVSLWGATKDDFSKTAPTDWWDAVGQWNKAAATMNGGKTF